MKKRAAIIASILAFAGSACPLFSGAEQTKPSSPVTVAEVWRAVATELRTRGFREDELPPADDLELPDAVPARPGRNLHVSSVCWDSDAERARFRIECRETGACLPFLVYLRGHGGERVTEGNGAAAHARAPVCRLEGGGRSTSASSSSGSGSSLASQRAEPLVRAGGHATAVRNGLGLRMTAAVTCLDRGARGEIIRVRGQEGRIFRARVTGAALVEALPE